MRYTLWMRLGALVVLFVLGASYIAFDVAGETLGAQPFTVTVELPNAGGIYPAASVNYRGVAVGKVTGLDLQADHVAVKLSISAGTRIPADTAATVRELTAAGEQYMDLVPRSANGPYLKGGSVVREGNAAVPVSVGTVLSDTNALLKSVNTADLSTIDETLAAGLSGAGVDLRNIIVGGQAVTMALAESEPATVTLINSGNQVLGTLDATNAAFAQFSASLSQLSAQLANSNSDVSSLLANGATGFSQTSLLLNQSSGNFAQVIDNLSTVGDVGAAQSEAMQALFQALPIFAGRIASVAGNGSIRVELYINGSTPVCDYAGAPSAPPTAATSQVFLNGTCSAQAPDLLQRGANTAPKATNS